MQVFNNEIVCYRNESWTLDKYVKCKDGTPYIVSNRLKNPYLLITVSNAKYTQNKKYIGNWWLDLSNYPKFECTTPVRKDTDWSDVSDASEGDAVYYRVENGVKVYKYYDSYTQTYIPYNFRIVHTFLQKDTCLWVDQNYQYSIQLVSGNSTKEVLQSLCEVNNIESSNDINDMYSRLKDVNIDSVKNISLERPLYDIDYSFSSVILPPTRLTVNTDIRGGIQWR